MKSAREDRPPEVLTANDRSKSVPAEKEASPRGGLQIGGGGMLPNRKQEYAEELRRQMDEQRKAKLRERKEYFSPAKPGNSR